MITYAAHGDAREAEEEELIETWDEDSPDNADEPSPKGTTGHVGVIRVRDGGTDFRVGRVVLCP